MASKQYIYECSDSEFLKKIEEKYRDEIYDKGNSWIILTKDGTCLKMYNKPREMFLNRIITSEDYDLDCFAFPIKIYAEKVYTEDEDLLRGYETKYVNNEMLLNDLDGIHSLDFGLLEEAYPLLIEDVEVLSNDGILLWNLDGNILFNGEKLVVINTIDYGIKKGYTRVSKDKGEPMKGFMDSFIKPNKWKYNNVNITSVDKAIGSELAVFSGNDRFKNCKSFKDIKDVVIDEYGSTKKVKRKVNYK